MNVAKTIHQTWKTNDIPHDVYQKHWIDSWKIHNPDWDYILWTDEMAERLIRESFSWFYSTYLSFPRGIYRADCLRYCVLYQFGGLYVDLDFLCLKNITPLLGDYDLVFGAMSHDLNSHHSIPNAFLAARPRSPFWLHLLLQIAHNRKHYGLLTVEHACGPEALRRGIKSYFGHLSLELRSHHEVARICPPQAIYPIDWHERSIHEGSLRNSDLESPQDTFPEAYAITYWTHNWKDLTSLSLLRKETKSTSRTPILLVLNTGTIMGGTELCALDLLMNLDTTHYLPIVVCPERGTVLSHVRSLGVVGLNLHTSQMPGKITRLLATTILLTYLILLYNITIVHVYSHRISQRFPALIASLLTSAQYLYHVHDVVKLGRRVEVFLAKRSSKIVCVSSSIKEIFSTLDLKHPPCILHNGIDINRFKPIDISPDYLATIGVEPGTPLVGTFSRLIKGKGLEDFILMAARVRKQVPNVRFLIAGCLDKRNNYHQKLLTLAEEKKVSEKIIFLGQRFDIPMLMNCCDVIMALSDSPEAFGRTVAEAMACEKAIIASNLGGHTDIIKEGNSGILVPPGDVSTTTEWVLELLKDKEKAQELGRNGRKRVEKMFAIKNHVEAIQEIYDSLDQGLA